MTAAKKRTQPTSLPSVGDSSWASTWDSARKMLTRLHGYVSDGRPVWWQREQFHLPENREAPRWHIFNGRVRSTNPETRWIFTWRALCGYENERTEIIFGVNDFRVTAPKKATRCKRCEEALKHINKLAADAAQETSTPPTN